MRMGTFDRLMIAGLAAVTVFAPIANAQDVEAGRIIAQRYCSTCHEIGKKPAYSAMAPSFADIARRPVATSGALNAFLGRPHDRMPNYLMRQEISDVSAYIISLNRP